MVQLISRFVTLILSQYIYIKVLNIKLNDIGTLRIIFGVLSSIVLTYFMVVMNEIPIQIRLITMVLALGLTNAYLTKTKLTLALTATTISVGVSQGAALLFLIATGAIFVVAVQSINQLAATLIAVITQSIATILLFKIRRLSKGILFLQKKHAGNIGVILGGIIIIIMIIIGLGVYVEIGILLTTGTVLCIVGIIIWWRRGLTKQYRERMSERKIKEYENRFAEKDLQIKKLIDDNEAMAKLIHRDNKLLPALYDAAQTFISTDSDSSDEAKRLIDQIQQHLDERSGILKQVHYRNKSLPSTDDAVLDALLVLMQTKAISAGVDFSVSVNCAKPEQISAIISSINLQTVCADIIENAIIATRSSELKKVEFSINDTETFPELCVSDSGIDFEAETLMNIGVSKTTTHLDEGGSGIGFLTIFEILKKYKASITITEFENRQQALTKSVAIKFDGNCEYTIKSPRASELIALREASGRRDDAVIILQ